MAFNNGYPATYPQMYYTPQYQIPQYQMQLQQMQQQAQNQQNQQTQTSFVLVRSEEEARNYPVAPGNSITFKDESRNYCYVKSMGFNQLDSPTFERYRLVKEDDAPAAQNGPVQPTSREVQNPPQYALKTDLTALWDEIDALKLKLNKKPKLTEDENDDE